MKIKGKELFLITVGSFLMAAATNIVYAPMSMVTGGVSGLAIIIKTMTAGWIDEGVPLWISNVIINVPLFLVAMKVKGRGFIMKTLFATVSFTVGLYIIPEIRIIYDDYLLASVFGGVIMGVGLGFVFVAGTSTGGTDLMGAVVHRFFRHYSVAQIIFGIDAAIVLAGAVIFGVKLALYAVIAIYITTKVMESILEGIKFGKLAFIISDKHIQIAEEILRDVKRGVTSIPITGMYSQNNRKMLLCVTSAKEIIEIVDVAARIDPLAFIIVTDVREVMGEGFREYIQ